MLIFNRIKAAILKHKQILRFYPIAAIFLMGFPVILLYQNAASPTYDNATLLNYYNTMVAQCTATDHRNCQGEVKRTSYFQGPAWGTTNNPNEASMMGVRPVNQKIIYRGTGVYVSQLSNFDAYVKPSSLTEYSYAFDTATSTIKYNPSRSKSMTYYNNYTAIPGNIEGLTYHVYGLPLSTTTAGIGTDSNTYLPNGKLSSNLKYGVQTDYSYDSQGNLSAVSNYRDGTKSTAVTFSNYFLGIAQNTTKPMGVISSKVINNDGTVAYEADSYGNRISYQYDANFRISRITPPLNAATTIAYPDENTKIETRASQQTITYSDVLGRVYQTIQKDLNDSTKVLVVNKSYDDDGRLIYQSLPGWGMASNYGQQTTYDVLDRITQTKRTGDSATTQFTYESPDASTELKPTGHKVKYSHLNYGSPTENQLIQISEDKKLNASSAADRITTNITRDIEGKVRLVNQAGINREFIYNSNQLLTQMKDPERSDTFLTYFGGSPLLKSKQIGVTAPINYSYDSADRISQVTFSNASNNISYTYDTNNRVASVSTATSQKSFQFDANSNKKSELLAIDGYNFQLDFAYDSLDHNNSITYPDTSAFGGATATPRNTLFSTLDAFGRPTNMRDNFNTLISSAIYSPNGMYSSLTYGNYAQSTLSLTSNQWPKILYVSSGANQISLAYNYDSVGNIKNITDQLNSAYTQNMTYDGISRLTSATFPNASSLVPYGQPANLGGSLTYSDSGDIKTYTEFGRDQTLLNYEPTSQLLASSSGGMGARNYYYDTSGQMTSNGVSTFAYDPNLNMATVKNASTGLVVASYVYDAFDMRIKKTVGGQTTYYIYANGAIAFEASVAKGAKEYFYLDSKLVSTRAMKSSSANYQYYHFNPISSVIAITKPDQSMIQERYNSFGSKLVANSNFSDATTVRFAGHISDDETNLIYMKGRYYDPSIGRFLTPDPVDFKDSNRHSFNRYAYANNNPHKFVDPNGHDAVDAQNNTDNSTNGLYSAPTNGTIRGSVSSSVSKAITSAASVVREKGLQISAKGEDIITRNIKHFGSVTELMTKGKATFDHGFQLVKHGEKYIAAAAGVAKAAPYVGAIAGAAVSTAAGSDAVSTVSQTAAGIVGAAAGVGAAASIALGASATAGVAIGTEIYNTALSDTFAPSAWKNYDANATESARDLQSKGYGY